ncbi:alpha-L-rhamnosidase [uncultured Duncaniella sp.]|uniref:alpha-L-rhamnosidase n=1 Tax=uncultured Duncaniella sp. TaxID=2768039 RepID=UPI0025A9337B|nr:alpha-L-rhamnosidase [uncultured Duncaniella sp.]
MKRILYMAILLLASLPLRAIEVGRMTCEMTDTPLAVDTDTPRFGWQLKGDNGTMQSAYQIELFTRDGKKTSKVWNSGKVKSSQSQLVAYSGPRLEPMTRYYWRVKVWDEKGKASAWSNPAEFRIAPDSKFLDGKWIGAVSYEQANLPEGRNYTYDKWKKPEVKEAWERVDSMASRSIILRTEFDLPKKIADATVYVCGLGHYELSLNGEKVGDGEFTPLWSDYDKTVYFNTYDVTDMLHSGENAMGVLLGNGFYNVVRGNRYSKLQIGFGPETLWVKMLVRYTDGSSEIIETGDNWKYDLSPITFHSIYGGEDYDARLEQPGWDRAGFDDSKWHPVVVQQSPKGKLTPQLAPPVKIMERFPVKSRHKLTADEIEKGNKATKRTIDPSAILLDMGQNLAGFPEITLKGKPGQKVTMVVGESITDDNAANQRQTGRQHYYTYTLRSDKPETWHPRFSYYGFRYIQVEGAVFAGEPNPEGLPVIEDIKSCFIYNSASEGGEFECSSEVLTAAHRLIRNAVRSNMQSVFTDCPHREKLGWLEQVHLNGPGLLYNYDLTSYYPKVLRDIADSQRADGMVPTVAPQYVVFEGPGMDDFAESPEWGATLIIAPWMYYEAYGDDSLIREYYPNMLAYVDYLGTRADGNLIDFGLGDWYDYGDFRAGFSRNTPVGLVASAHYYMDLIHVIKAAELLGKKDDAARYQAIADKVRDAFNKKYFDPATSDYGTGSQTSNALPLFLGMIPEGKKQAVLDNLVGDIREHGVRLTTGDVGNRYLFRALADNGLDSIMYRMHNHYDAPGYGFQLQFGATTLTEQWDPRQGSSWNHFMMGQIDEWLFRSLAGIRIDESRPGMQHLIIEPSVVGDLTSVRGRTATLYGDVEVDWRRNGDDFTLDVTLPANVSADVILPGETQSKPVKSGKYTFSSKIK